MGNEAHSKDPRPESREPRFLSHALVEIRHFKSLPLFCHSAILLDISPGGFKLELTGESVVKNGQIFWLYIPLSPLGIYTPKCICCRSESRWFDERTFRMGGTFLQLSPYERTVIEQIIVGLSEKGDI